jgi:hypothetical protein
MLTRASSCDPGGSGSPFSGPQIENDDASECSRPVWCRRVLKAVTDKRSHEAIAAGFAELFKKEQITTVAYMIANGDTRFFGFLYFLACCWISVVRPRDRGRASCWQAPGALRHSQGRGPETDRRVFHLARLLTGSSANAHGRRVK